MKTEHVRDPATGETATYVVRPDDRDETHWLGTAMEKVREVRQQEVGTIKALKGGKFKRGTAMVDVEVKDYRELFPVRRRLPYPSERDPDLLVQEPWERVAAPSA